MAIHPHQPSSFGDLVVAAFDAAKRVSNNPKVVAAVAALEIRETLRSGVFHARHAPDTWANASQSDGQDPEEQGSVWTQSVAVLAREAGG